MHIHILGICGTFMGGIAAIAKEAGHTVSGCDQNIYPPMSEQLEKLGINLINGYGAEQTLIKPDIFLIGNGISRGNPLLEEILDKNLPYTSAPQWLYENVLRHRHVLAVAGTHGKTTTTSYLTFIISEYCKAHNLPAPGYLIGGVCPDFPFSASLGEKYFIIEADEYDTAFFDKRSKFVHYHPQTLILNNLEFDHADIFENLKAIETQFHHLVRTLSRRAKIVINRKAPALINVINKALYSEVIYFNDDDEWNVNGENGEFYFVNNRINPKNILPIPKNIFGEHNRLNLLSAMLAAEHIGININLSLDYIARFQGVRRRLELRGEVAGIKVYDDFAHHPSAIATTINALKELISCSDNKNTRIFAVIEPRSNTMKMGVFAKSLAESLKGACQVYGYNKNLGWDLAASLTSINAQCFENLDELISSLTSELKTGDVVLGMSNGGFDGFYDKLLNKLTHH